MSRILTNRTGPPGGVLVLGGAIFLVAGIALIVMRFADPTPVIIAVAAVLVVAGFTLLINGGLTLASHPVWTEGMVQDRRWTVRGARRVGVIVLNTGAVEPFVVEVGGAVFAALAVGDHVRVEHGSLDRARVSRIEVLEENR